MELFYFLKRESGKSLQSITGIAVISGISNAMLLAIVNSATSTSISRGDLTKYFLLYLLSISLFIFTKQHILKKSAILVEDIIKNLRIRIANKIRHSDLLHLEETGTSSIFTRISQDAAQISQTVTYVGNAFQSAVMVLFSVVYIAFISIPAFLITLTSILLGITTYYRYRKSATALLKQASNKEAEFYGSLNELLGGFKEIKVNQKKNNDVFESFKTIAEQSSDFKLKAILKLIISYIASQSFFYVLLAFIIFLLPNYVDVANKDLIRISAAVLFIIGPLESIISSLPILLTANVSAANITKLEHTLDGYTDATSDPAQETTIREPLAFNQEIVFADLLFEYPKKDLNEQFAVGPISLCIKKGTITFITGGNGSGKSTFLKLACGLYYPEKGNITVDDIEINKKNYPNYRELFSIIFTDFHLFQKLYGLPNYEQAIVDKLLNEMQIDKKTRVIDGHITNIQLSTGQRKRLALVAAILENKSVYIFDEVAADQDPQFKNYFYKVLLPKLKESGKTIIAVTHDEYFFDDCDYRYKIENGNFIGVETK
ncbi:MAG: cyclic peptide export ABC transporter [Pedobacter sp.]|nr:cyclic peptide export ABC transporter [Pedobacter sp.]